MFRQVAPASEHAVPPAAPPVAVPPAFVPAAPAVTLLSGFDPPLPPPEPELETLNSKLTTLVWWRVEYEVIGIVSKGFCFQPSGPAEAARFAKAGGRYFLGAQDQLDIPEEMLAAIVEHPIPGPFEGIALGQHPLVIGEVHGSKAHAETELAIPETRADDGVKAETASARSGG